MTLFDDVRKLAETVDALDKRIDKNRSALERHEEQLNGQRGLSAAVNDLAAEIKSLRRAAYWVAGIIVAGAITFAFSVLSLIGG